MAPPPPDEPHRPEDRTYDSGPWWAGLGPIGAMVLILGGVVWAVWSFLRLPGDAQGQALGYYRAGRVIAIGLVIAGTALLGRMRARASGAAEPSEEEREAGDGASVSP
ncbi:hypothetical protein HEK616_09410 [Streptomyces nigrescens]|uniref:Integral membrane protein n=1 Tax=Streptomyces nigrescens TaxID=1920 RepID=A0ABN6QMK4_STRNI|nr:hypothetical protein [Streptomyces nigrescens]BDM67454.1 hypothetical protein HEK616_09410 [Streptomyces nigrescens]